MVFKVGDNVLVTDWGSLYSLDESGAKKMGVFKTWGGDYDCPNEEWRTRRNPGTITAVDPDDKHYLAVRLDDGTEDYIIGSDGLKLVKRGKLLGNKSIMNKLTSALKRALSKPLQKQYKAGIINGELELTDEGRNILLDLLSVKQEKELTARAEEIIKEAKEEK